MIRAANIAILVLLAGAAGHVAASDVAPLEARFSTEQLAAARAELAERVEGCAGANRCAGIYAEIVLAERPGGALEALARQNWIANVGRTRGTLYALWPRVAPDAKAEILDAFREHWSLLAQGVEPALAAMVREGLESDDDTLLVAAARLAATRPVPRIAWPVIDAAAVHPELTQAALLAVGQERAGYAARWAVETALSTDDPAMRDAARWTVFRLGRQTADRLKEAIDGPDDDRAARAVSLLLVIAIPEDSATLMRWLESRGEARPELAEQVRRALAALETGILPRTAPPAPEPDLPDAHR